LAKLKLDAALDEIEQSVALLAVAVDVFLAEGSEEGVVGGLGVLDREAGKGVVGSAEQGAVGEVALHAVVELLRDQGRAGLGELEADRLDDPLGVDVLEVGHAQDRLQRDAVVQALKTVLVPVLAVGVVLDEVHGANTAVNLEAVLVAVPWAIGALCNAKSVHVLRLLGG
jgi:hypothetical protein